MDGPERYVLLFDALNNTIGLNPAGKSTPNAFPAARRGIHGGRVVHARRLCSEFGITVPQNVRFENPKNTRKEFYCSTCETQDPHHAHPDARLDACVEYQ